MREILPADVERVDRLRGFDDPANVPRPRGGRRERHLSTETKEEPSLRLLGRRFVPPELHVVGDGVGPEDEEVDVLEIDVAKSRPF